MTTYITSEDGTYNVSFNKYIPPGRSIVISMADFNFLNLLQPVTGHVKLINYTYMIFQIYADTPADYFTIKWNFMLISSDAVFAFQASYEYLYLLTNATTIQ